MTLEPNEEPKQSWHIKLDILWPRWTWLVGPLVFVVMAYLALQWTMGAIIHHRPECLVPDLKGRPLQEALNLISEAGLALKKEGEQFHESFPPGAVLAQNPSAGTKVREGKIVRVTVSQGGEMVFVPALVGIDIRKAEIDLRQKNFALGEISQSYSLRFKENEVISQDPPGGNPAAKNSLVSLVISKGPPKQGVVLLPDFTSKTLNEASRWAKTHGVSLAPIRQEPSESMPGTIIRQNPAADTVVEKKTILELTVAAPQ